MTLEERASVCVHEPGASRACVPAEDVEVGVEMTYTLSLVDKHTHEITVTTADFSTLQQGQSVTVVSTSDGAPPHTHSVTLVCS